MASLRGFEPPTPRLGGVCSILLSYRDLSETTENMFSVILSHYEIVGAQ